MLVAVVLNHLERRTGMWPCCMRLSHFLCRVLLEELLDLSWAIGRRGEMPLATRSYLEVLNRDEGRSKPCIVGMEGLDELSRGLSGGC
jgi:hypothetical protein